MVERLPCKQEVTGSIPVLSTRAAQNPGQRLLLGRIRGPCGVGMTPENRIGAMRTALMIPLYAGVLELAYRLDLKSRAQIRD